ncbi:hypothetical protein BJ165DRAFT_1405410 [Panaeolus papilionaceus]|nr:hypothetical protein BJ165DRAFT_1405410 [Panaeolus papilionaceus]
MSSQHFGIGGSELDAFEDRPTVMASLNPLVYKCDISQLSLDACTISLCRVYPSSWGKMKRLITILQLPSFKSAVEVLSMTIIYDEGCDKGQRFVRNASNLILRRKNATTNTSMYATRALPSRISLVSAEQLMSYSPMSNTKEGLGDLKGFKGSVRNTFSE